MEAAPGRGVEDVRGLGYRAGTVPFTSVQQPLLTADGHVFKRSLSVSIS